MPETHTRLEVKPNAPAPESGVAQAAIYWSASGELDVYHEDGFRTLFKAQALQKLEELRQSGAAIVYID